MDGGHCSVTTSPTNAVHMPRRDFFRLPAEMRDLSDGLKVRATENGRQVFKPVILH